MVKCLCFGISPDGFCDNMLGMLAFWDKAPECTEEQALIGGDVDPTSHSSGQAKPKKAWYSNLKLSPSYNLMSEAQQEVVERVNAEVRTQLTTVKSAEEISQQNTAAHAWPESGPSKNKRLDTRDCVPYVSEFHHINSVLSGVVYVDPRTRKGNDYSHLSQSIAERIDLVTTDVHGEYVKANATAGAPSTHEVVEDGHRSRAGTLRRRLAAIPVSGSTEPLEVQQVEAESELSMPVLGTASVALVCIGYALRRRFMQRKQEAQRDSFGFLPDELRTSLNAAELMV